MKRVSLSWLWSRRDAQIEQRVTGDEKQKNNAALKQCKALNVPKKGPSRYLQEAEESKDNEQEEDAALWGINNESMSSPRNQAPKVSQKKLPPTNAGLGSTNLAVMCATNGPAHGNLIMLSDQGKAHQVDKYGKTTATWDAHSKSVSSASSFRRPDTNRYMLMTGSRDYSVKCWDENHQCVLEIPNAHELNISTVCTSKDSFDYFASASRDTWVKVWDCQGKSLAEQSRARNIATCMKFSSGDGGSLLWQGSEDLAVRAWDWRRSPMYQPVQALGGYVYFPTCMDVYNHTLMTGCKGFDGRGCEVYFWDLRNLSRPIATLPGHDQEVVACSFLGNGEAALTLAKDRTLRVWNLAEGCVNPAGKYELQPSSSLPVTLICEEETLHENKIAHVRSIGFKGDIQDFTFNYKSMQLIDGLS